MIKADNIFKSFGETKVLKGITTVFEPSKCNLIIGRSGAGKTVSRLMTNPFVKIRRKKLSFNTHLLKLYKIQGYDYVNIVHGTFNPLHSEY